ncbi:glutamyl-tRNA reductase [Terribacillus aidingensis]|uniref:Glutamyl-tRNA reductase n=1 Tax=Terribacillus aidingensis TaxID=586416 RepID=A0A285NPL5_9BACI|nr:glutamyl-tRNA reductase [Terribacillus aidingensis]SNZ11470.1 glutamyl-tRNA reductase [Terribacillus aidingensis]
MYMLVAGINYRTAPIEIRERLTFKEEELGLAMQALSNQKSMLENVIVSTCNRTEIYAVVDQMHTGRYYIKKFLSEWFGIEKEEIASYLTFHEDERAVEHLYRVASGLDSMVVGETQILGQLKRAFQKAQELHTSGTIYNELFKQAVTVAKRAHTETGIGENAVSVSYAAVELSKKIFGDIASKRVVILGAGKMGELAAKNLHGSGVQDVTVVNRTKEKAEQLAALFNGKAAGWDELESALEHADIVISSTGAPGYVLDKQILQPILKVRKGQPLFLVDIAVPRDINPDVDELESTFLYDIDDLQDVVDANLAARQEAVENIEIMIEGGIVDFKLWLQTLGVVPVITELRRKAASIQTETMKSLERKLPNLSEREIRVLNKHTKSIVNQMLKQPITQAKELAGRENSEELIQQFAEIFGIEKSVLDKQNNIIKLERHEAQNIASVPNASTTR